MTNPHRMERAELRAAIQTYLALDDLLLGAERFLDKRAVTPLSAVLLPHLQANAARVGAAAHVLAAQIQES